MFWHNFKYSLKILIKNKTLLFWTFVFPIILGFFFNMAFSNIEKDEILNTIDIAIIDNEQFKNEEIFKEAFNTLSDDKNDEKIFNITYTDEKNAEKLLKDKEITGYLLFSDEVNIKVNTSGINETILHFVVDEISSNKEIINNLANIEINKNLSSGNSNINYEEIYEHIELLINEEDVKLNDISNKNLSYTMIEYYTLIAMACLYGGIISMFTINYKLANMNSVGKRGAISPAHKGKMILGSLFASLLGESIGIFILFIFLIFGIKVDFGDNLLMVILLASCGSVAGLTLGIAVGTLFKTNENTKTGILMSITMLGCFLSGMMGITMKYIVDKNVPIVNKINPASMITDGFYSLYYYNTLDRFYLNIVSLLVFSLVMVVISYKGLRRQKYDSI